MKNVEQQLINNVKNINNEMEEMQKIEFFTKDFFDLIKKFNFLDTKFNRKIIPFYFGSKIKDNNLLDFKIKKEENDDEIIYYCGFDKLILNKKTNVYSIYLNGKNITPYFFLEKIKKEQPLTDDEKNRQEQFNVLGDVLNLKDLFHFKVNHVSPLMKTNVLDFKLKENIGFVSNNKKYLNDIFSNEEVNIFSKLLRIKKINYNFHFFNFLENIFLPNEECLNENYKNTFLYLLSLYLSKRITNDFGYYDFFNSFLEKYNFVSYNHKIYSFKDEYYNFTDSSDGHVSPYNITLRKQENIDEFFNGIIDDVKEILGEEQYNSLFLNLKKLFIEKYKNLESKNYDDIIKNAEKYKVKKLEHYFSLFISLILFSEFYLLNLPFIFTSQTKKEGYLSKVNYERINDEFQKTFSNDFNNKSLKHNVFYKNNGETIKFPNFIKETFDVVFKNKNVIKENKHFTYTKEFLSNQIDYQDMINIYFFKNKSFDKKYKKDVILFLFDFFEKIISNEIKKSPLEFLNSNFSFKIEKVFQLLSQDKQNDDFEKFFKHSCKTDLNFSFLEEEILLLKNRLILSNNLFNEKTMEMSFMYKNLHKNICSTIDLNDIQQKNKKHLFNLLLHSFPIDLWRKHEENKNIKKEDFLKAINLYNELSNNLNKVSNNSAFYPSKNNVESDILIEEPFEHPKLNETNVKKQDHNIVLQELDFDYSHNKFLLKEMFHLFKKMKYHDYSYYFSYPFFTKKIMENTNFYYYSGKNFKENLVTGYLRNIIKNNKWLPVYNKLTEDIYINEIVANKHHLLTFIAFNNFIETQPLLKNLIEDNFNHYSQYPLFFNNDFVYDRKTKKIAITHNDLKDDPFGKDLKTFSSFKLKEKENHILGKIVLDKNSQKMLNKYNILHYLNSGFKYHLDLIKNDLKNDTILNQKIFKDNLEFLSKNNINTKYGLLHNTIFLPYDVFKNYHLFENEIEKILKIDFLDFDALSDITYDKAKQDFVLKNTNMLLGFNRKISQHVYDYETILEDLNSKISSIEKYNNSFYITKDKNLTINTYFKILLNEFNFDKNNRVLNFNDVFNKKIKKDFLNFIQKNYFQKEYIQSFFKKILLQINLENLNKDEIIALSEEFIKNYLYFMKAICVICFLNEQNQINRKNLFNQKSGLFKIDFKNGFLHKEQKINIFLNLKDFFKEEKENNTNNSIKNVSFNDFYLINQKREKYYKSFLNNVYYCLYQNILLLNAISMENPYFKSILNSKFFDCGQQELKQIIVLLDSFLTQIEKYSFYYKKLSNSLNFFKQIDFYNDEKLFEFLQKNKEDCQLQINDLINDFYLPSFLNSKNKEFKKNKYFLIQKDLSHVEYCFNNLNIKNALKIKEKVFFYLKELFNYIDKEKHDMATVLSNYFDIFGSINFYYNHQDDNISFSELSSQIKDFSDVFFLVSQRNLIQKDDNIFRILTINKQLHHEINNKITENDSKYNRYVDLIFFKDDNFIAYQPYAQKEFVAESRKLNHCIHTYYKNSKDGKYLPFFIRKMTDDVKDKYDKDNFNYLSLDKTEYEECATLGYNMNIRDNKIKISFDQYRTYNNQNVNDDFENFKLKLEKELKHIIKGQNKEQN